MSASRRRRIALWVVAGFLAYGLVVGFLSVSWRESGRDMKFPLNIPGELLGEEVYLRLRNPYSAASYREVPWVLRIPQVYVPASVVFWGSLGLLIGGLVWVTRGNAEASGGA